MFSIPIAFSWQNWANTVLNCQFLNLNDPNQPYHILVVPTENYGVRTRAKIDYFLQIRNALGEAIVSSIAAIINLILNSITLLTLYIRRKNLSGKSNDSYNQTTHALRRSERNLLILALILFLNTTLISIIQVGKDKCFSSVSLLFFMAPCFY